MDSQAQQGHVLERIARCGPSGLLNKDFNEKRNLTNLYVECCNSGLIDDKTLSDDASQLGALFTVVTNHGLACVVIDYLQEVCLDETVTSSNIEEAYLTDGGCITSWCKSTLATIEHSLSSQLSQYLAGVQPCRFPGLPGLVEISQALVDSSTDQALSEAMELFQTATKLRQVCKVLNWIQTAKISPKPRFGRYASAQEWQLAIKQKRDLKLTGLLDEVMDSVYPAAKGAAIAKHYPFPSIDRAVQSLFLAPFDYKNSWQPRLQLFLYYLLESGVSMNVKQFGYAFSMKAEDAMLVQIYQLLTESSSNQASPNFEQACTYLQDSALQRVPFKVIAFLEKLGHCHIARQFLSKCERLPVNGSKAALAEVIVLIRLLLHDGQLTEAYFKMKAYLRSLETVTATTEEIETRNQQHLSELGACLSVWAAGTKHMGQLIALPWSPTEEKVLLQWLRTKIERGEGCGDGAVVYLLQRRRLLEAVELYKSLQPLQDSNKESRQFRAQLDSLIKDAQAAIPQVELYSLGQSQAGELHGIAVAN